MSEYRASGACSLLLLLRVEDIVTLQAGRLATLSGWELANKMDRRAADYSTGLWARSIEIWQFRVNNIMLGIYC